MKNIIAAICGIILIACMAAGLRVSAAETDDVVYVDIDGDGQISRAEVDYAQALKAMQDYHERLAAREAAGLSASEEVLFPEEAAENEEQVTETAEETSEIAAAPETEDEVTTETATESVTENVTENVTEDNADLDAETDTEATVEAVEAVEATETEETAVAEEATEEEAAAEDETAEETTTENTSTWNGTRLTKTRGTVKGPSGRETYYNLNMSPVITLARQRGVSGSYWVRDDGCKMYGDYIIAAANYRVHPYGSILETTLGTAKILDTGGFASYAPRIIDIATNW